jgi:hypothetical protein
MFADLKNSRFKAATSQKIQISSTVRSSTASRVILLLSACIALSKVVDNSLKPIQAVVAVRGSNQFQNKPDFRETPKSSRRRQ